MPARDFVALVVLVVDDVEAALVLEEDGVLRLDDREGESSISGDGFRCVFFSLDLLVVGRVRLVSFRYMRDERIIFA